MIQTVIKGVQVQSDGRTCWVNGRDGMSLARFGPVGVDIHKTTDEQLAGKHCEDCFKRTDDPEADWAKFVIGVASTHGICIPAKFRCP